MVDCEGNYMSTKQDTNYNGTNQYGPATTSTDVMHQIIGSKAHPNIVPLKTNTSIKNNTSIDTKLSSQEIDGVWDQFHVTGDSHYRNILMEHYQKVVDATAARIYSKLPDSVELDDLKSAGQFGLVNAIVAYDPERGVQFTTYAAPRVRGAILDELRSMDWVPRLVRSRARQLSNVTATLEANLGRLPDNHEIANELGIDPAEYQKIQRGSLVIGQVSIDKPANNGNNGTEPSIVLSPERP